MTLLNTIERIPSVARNFLESYDRLSLKLQKYLNEHNYKNINRICFVGSGTSYNASRMLESQIKYHWKLDFDVVYPEDFIKDRFEIYPDCIYMFVSQTGNTKLVFECLTKVKEKGFMNIAISENPEGVISKAADIFIDMETGGEEYIFRTIGYDMTFIISAFVCGVLKKADMRDPIKDLNLTIEKIDKIIAETQEWYQDNRELLLGKKAVYFIAQGQLLTMSQEAEIKFMEMLPIVSRAFGLEESIHGPQNSFDKDIVIFMSLREDQDYEKACAIFNFIKNECTDSVFLISQKIPDSQCNPSFQIDSGKRRFLALEYITFYQVIAYLMAVDMGRDLSKPVYPQLVNYFRKQY